STGGLDKHELGLRADLVKISGDARGKPATADWQDNKRTVKLFAQLLDQFPRHGRLPFDDVGMIEGRNHDCRRGSSVDFGCPVAIVEEGAHELNLNELTAKELCLGDLLPRGGNRHEDNALLTEVTASIGKALRMVACGGAHEALRAGIRLKRPTDEGKRTAHLIGPDGCLVFPLQEHMCTGLTGKIRVLLQRRWWKQFAQRLFGSVYPLNKSVHFRCPSHPVTGSSP